VIIRACLLPLLAWSIGSVLGGPISRLDVKGIMYGAAGYFLLSFSIEFMLKYRILLALRLGERVVHDLRQGMFTHLQQQTMSFFNRTKLGRIISRFTSDADAVRSGMQDVLFVSMVNSGQMIVSALMMLWFDWALFLIILCMAPILWGLNRYFWIGLGRAYRAVQESFSRITGTMAESVKGIRVTQGFDRQQMNAEMFQELLNDHANYNLTAARASGIFMPLLDINSQLFSAILVLIGGWRVFNGSMDMAHLYQFIMISQVFFGPVQALGNQYNNALISMAGAERVFNFLDTTPDWSDPSDTVTLASLKGRIEFKSINFSYNPDKPILKDLSFVVEPGMTVALAGQTGSGKTTIINLISKFYLPTSGVLLIDGIEIHKINTQSLHEHMGIVLQQNFLFSGTVIENIRVGKPSATLEEIAEAARKLDCLSVLESLPDGLSTLIGEGGSGISLGQRQLICFTRAMLANPGILILDEATSSVDTVTEARIQKSLAILLKGRTSLVVAHRLSTIRHADTVLVMENGRLIEQGPHSKLLRKRGHYAALYKKFIS
ncbi:MAG: ABC transporter ATP-binding protein, partial [bacterium]